MNNDPTPTYFNDNGTEINSDLIPIMQTLEDLAKSYLALEKCDTSEFQRKARLLQSMWREEKGYDVGEHGGKKRGNYLPMPWAEETLSNYLSEAIKTVVFREVVNNSIKGKQYTKPRIFDNLLSSQPLCFNLFAELQQNLELATEVFTQLSPDRILKITSIKFEHSPGRGDLKYTGDSSAFDVYVEFLNKTEERGFVGIEVKYHENLKVKPAKMKDRYFEVASEMNCFRDDCLNKLQISPLEQIWRDHLLSGSLLNSEGDGFKDGFFVFLSPKENPHCQEAVEEYRKCLTDDSTFLSWTLEDVTEAIKRNTEDSWIDELIDRYLTFGKINEAYR